MRLLYDSRQRGSMLLFDNIVVSSCAQHTEAQLGIVSESLALYSLLDYTL